MVLVSMGHLRISKMYKHMDHGRYLTIAFTAFLKWEYWDDISARSA
jgi:hypothetical protein